MMKHDTFGFGGPSRLISMQMMFQARVKRVGDEVAFELCRLQDCCVPSAKADASLFRSQDRKS
jgi:hypothetical protein